MEKKEFINSIKEGALKGYTEYRIFPSVTIAQAILESGWGRSQLAERANRDRVTTLRQQNRGVTKSVKPCPGTHTRDDIAICEGDDLVASQTVV